MLVSKQWNIIWYIPENDPARLKHAVLIIKQEFCQYFSWQCGEDLFFSDYTFFTGVAGLTENKCP